MSRCARLSARRLSFLDSPITKKNLAGDSDRSDLHRYVRSATSTGSLVVVRMSAIFMDVECVGLSNISDVFRSLQLHPFDARIHVRRRVVAASAFLEIQHDDELAPRDCHCRRSVVGDTRKHEYGHRSLSRDDSVSWLSRRYSAEFARGHFVLWNRSLNCAEVGLASVAADLYRGGDRAFILD